MFLDEHELIDDQIGAHFIRYRRFYQRFFKFRELPNSDENPYLNDFFLSFSSVGISVMYLISSSILWIVKLDSNQQKLKTSLNSTKPRILTKRAKKRGRGAQKSSLMHQRRLSLPQGFKKIEIRRNRQKGYSQLPALLVWRGKRILNVIVVQNLLHGDVTPLKHTGAMTDKSHHSKGSDRSSYPKPSIFSLFSSFLTGI